MNKLLFFIVLSLLSCQKQSKDLKKNSDKKIIKQDLAFEIVLKKQDTISFDSKFTHKLSDKETISAFSKKTKNKLGITYPISQAYLYKDKSGEHYLLLTEHTLIDKKNDTIYDKIQAFNLNYANNIFKKRSTISDFIDKEWETSISFWNKYSELADIDNDGMTDLILVYGTTGQEMYTDGRVKIMIYHNRKRITIRHQNSNYGGRLTNINKRFYELPLSIQQVIKEKMRLMVKNKHATFSQDWEKKMANKTTNIEG
ncbi:M949_RS01915 family surface polysaccharide biosynthesis protein [Aquimarina muelleri]|uniref:Lipoprotein n=1 Tax=Aquimarina muelleri TaxID=279356 RepID=A0A918JVK7_9FLAO|nr:hypothetical protein [Aquimarina muelleri]MCX2761809.1 hypothetical protein [Aquimarina muelleri]GGX23385.1 hypothetical protein GCM10007384_25740 [Aquimarina muelleri]